MKRPAKKFTVEMLKQMVNEEIEKLKKSPQDSPELKDVEKAEVTDADELADSLENQINFAKALGLEEDRLRKKLNRISERRARILRKIGK